MRPVKLVMSAFGPYAKEEVVDYSKLKVAELKELLNERGIEIPKGAKKADLISLLSK